jgi:hypothetical protein
MAKKMPPIPKHNPTIEKAEEIEHKDLDDDGEKGESAAHRRKVLGKASSSSAKGKKKGGTTPPFPPAKGKGKPFPPAAASSAKPAKGKPSNGFQPFPKGKK